MPSSALEIKLQALDNALFNCEKPSLLIPKTASAPPATRPKLPAITPNTPPLKKSLIAWLRDALLSWAFCSSLNALNTCAFWSSLRSAKATCPRPNPSLAALTAPSPSTAGANANSAAVSSSPPMPSKRPPNAKPCLAVFQPLFERPAIVIRPAKPSTTAEPKKPITPPRQFNMSP